jgi:phosphoribosylglycinamide formyltransferase 1
MISEQNRIYSFVLFASGDGSNAENLWRFFASKKNFKVELLICDREEAGVIDRAIRDNIPYIIIAKKKMDTKTHESLIMKKLNEFKIDLILLCGYRRLLSKNFVEQFPKKILNIHPSLLPKYPGLHAYERAFHEGETLHGATVHFVDQGMDTGEIIVQKFYKRQSFDNFSDFKRRGMELEYQVYPEAVLKVIAEIERK